MGGNVLKIVLNEVQGQGTNINNTTHSFCQSLRVFTYIKKRNMDMGMDKKLCENETFDIVLQPIDDKTAKINNKKG